MAKPCENYSDLSKIQETPWIMNQSFSFLVASSCVTLETDTFTLTLIIECCIVSWKWRRLTWAVFHWRQLLNHISAEKAKKLSIVQRSVSYFLLLWCIQCFLSFYGLEIMCKTVQATTHTVLLIHRTRTRRVALHVSGNQ